jgi:thymidylate synthase ThyX
MSHAKIIADSMSEDGIRLTTIQVKFHRYILAEMNTHRVFSRNYSSSRAIPVAKLIEQVRHNPAMPVHWGKNQPGMQANEELDAYNTGLAKCVWSSAAKAAVGHAESLFHFGVHKQLVNRILEPYLWVEGIISSTEWDNFFGLRCHPDAQPEIQLIATLMRDALENSTPTLLRHGDWHLPYIRDEEKTKYSIETLRKMSAARCCRVSYLKHDGQNPNPDEDIALCDRLTSSVPIHASPFEHVATPVSKGSCFTGNFVGWRQFRQFLEMNHASI